MIREVRSLAPVLLLDPARSTFDEMLRGYAVSMRSRGLSEGTIRVSQYGVKRFFRFAGTYPWEWRPQDVEDFTSSLLSGPQPLAHSTIRGYHQVLKGFCGYISHPAYDWVDVCLDRFGAAPAQICHPWNTFAHLAEFEAKPARRPFGYDELGRSSRTPISEPTTCSLIARRVLCPHCGMRSSSRRSTRSGFGGARR